MEHELGGGGFRSHRLMKLHERAVELFVTSFGYGIGRMSPEFGESNLALPPGPAPPQPGSRVPLASSPGEWVLSPLPNDAAGFLLDESLEEFVEPVRFGYFKDRRHVAGFEAHRFDRVPDTLRPWRVQTLDLIGVLVEDEPRVYISARLPSMDELRGVDTRPVDRFEALGLKRMQAGDDLIVARDGDVIRMVGAIRSTRHCLTCHGGKRGELLGAFTYTLREDKRSAGDAVHPERDTARTKD